MINYFTKMNSNRYSNRHLNTSLLNAYFFTNNIRNLNFNYQKNNSLRYNYHSKPTTRVVDRGSKASSGSSLLHMPGVRVSFMEGEAAVAAAAAKAAEKAAVAKAAEEAVALEKAVVVAKETFMRKTEKLKTAKKEQEEAKKEQEEAGEAVKKEFRDLGENLSLLLKDETIDPNVRNKLKNFLTQHNSAMINVENAMQKADEAVRAAEAAGEAAGEAAEQKENAVRAEAVRATTEANAARAEAVRARAEANMRVQAAEEAAARAEEAKVQAVEEVVARAKAGEAKVQVAEANANNAIAELQRALEHEKNEMSKLKQKIDEQGSAINQFSLENISSFFTSAIHNLLTIGQGQENDELKEIQDNFKTELARLATEKQTVMNTHQELNTRIMQIQGDNETLTRQAAERAAATAREAEERVAAREAVEKKEANKSFFTPQSYLHTGKTEDEINKLNILKGNLVNKINERISIQNKLLSLKTELQKQKTQQSQQQSQQPDLQKDIEYNERQLKDIIKKETDLRNKWITNLLSLESVSDSITQTKFLKFIKERKNLEQVFNKIIDNKLNKEFGQIPGNDFFNRFKQIINKIDRIINNQNFIGGKIIQNIIDNINDELEINKKNVRLTGDTEDTKENQFIITLPKQEHYNLK